MTWRSNWILRLGQNSLRSKSKILIFTYLLGFILLLPSCKIYRFTDASVDPNIKTYSVNPTINVAVIQNPQASSLLTEKLKDKFTRETRMSLVQQNANVEFSCTITDYSVSPVILSDANTASQNRLSVNVKVEYVNKLDQRKNFSQNFNDGENYNANSTLNEVENSLINSIFDRIVQQIFNKTFGNW